MPKSLDQQSESINLPSEVGELIKPYIARMVEARNELGKTVVGRMNTIDLVCEEGDTVETIHARFQVEADRQESEQLEQYRQEFNMPGASAEELAQEAVRRSSKE